MLCFNRIVLSQQCLASYLNKISVPYERIIIDSALTDGIADWLEEPKRQTRIKDVVHMKTNDVAAGPVLG